jgi:hypothetical protein
MIQPVPKSNKEDKSITRQVNLAITSPPATTKYLHWSEQPIEFSRDDHPMILLVDVGDQRSLCMANDQLVGNPKRKV